MSTDLPRLLAISPGDGRDLHPWIDGLAESGLPGLLIREPQATPEQAQALWEYASQRIGWVIAHEKTPGLSSSYVASDGDPSQVPSPAGMSCHSESGLTYAFSRGASFALLSPVWRPHSKPIDHRTPLGPDRFVAIAAGRPVFALGGVTPIRHRRLCQRGAWGSAISGALFGQANPAKAAIQLREFLKLEIKA